MREKINFDSGGLRLSGALETPDTAPRCYAVFAHCFTCGKDVAAASRISRALTAAGIAVLRFDFTGLGNSDGDFANTNFSSNVQDILAAVDFLRREYEAPQLLVGHSLGGAAVLAMAAEVPEVKAVVTIGAPFKAEHVTRNFGAALEDIEREGAARVVLGGRDFLIRKQFLDDLAASSGGDLGRLRKALLVMHSPLDATVAVDEAEKIYRAARHPKSFISLDDADHLLSRKKDSEYVAATLAAWASRYLPPLDLQARPSLEKGEVLVEESANARLKFAQDVYSDAHHWMADEPQALGGADLGADPYEHLLAALGTCTSMTLRMYAERKNLPLDHVGVRLRHGRDYLTDCAGCDEKPQQIEFLERELTLAGNLTDEERTRLLEIADRCPVHKTLGGQPQIRTVLKKGP